MMIVSGVGDLQLSVPCTDNLSWVLDSECLESWKLP